MRPSSPEGILVPLDDRPATLLFTTQIARIGGASLQVPPAACLGNADTPGDTTALGSWLAALPSPKRPTPAFVSSDMLCYGGLLASRKARTTREQALASLDQLQRLHDRGYRVQVLATLPRLALRTSPTEAPYEDVLRRWAARPTGRPAGVPDAVVDEYLGVRTRNVEVVKALVAAAAQGTIDRLVIGQDDSSPQGLNVAEQQQVREAIAAAHAEARVTLMSGADEIAMDLVSGWLADEAHWQPRIRIEYSEPGAGSRVPELESLPLDSTVDAHLRLVHAVRAGDDEPADATLYLVTPRLHKARTLRAHQAYAAEHAHRVHELLDEGKPVGLSDLEHLNFSDPDLANAILQEIPLTRLECYAGWNTASNSLGTAVAQLVAHLAAARQARHWSPLEALESEKTQQAFVFARLVDDFWFQAIVRASRRGEAKGIQSDADPLLNLMGPVGLNIRTDLIPWAQRLFDGHFKGQVVRLPGNRRAARLERVQLGVVLPWKRVFEVELRADLEMRLLRAGAAE